MRMQWHKKWKDFVWNPVMVVKPVILVKDNMTTSDHDERKRTMANVWFTSDRTSEW